MEEHIESTAVATRTDETSVLSASTSVAVPIVSDRSDESEFIDDSDTDPIFILPAKYVSRPPVFPRRVSFSVPHQTLAHHRQAPTARVVDEHNRPELATADTQRESNTTLINVASTSVAVAASSVSEPKTCKKRVRNPAGWKSKIAKTLRNTGNSYISLTNSTKLTPERSLA